MAAGASARWEGRRGAGRRPGARRAAAGAALLAAWGEPAAALADAPRARQDARRPPPPRGAAGAAETRGVLVRNHERDARSATRFVVPVGALEAVPRQSAGELLSLVPGVMLGNEGVDGHAHQVFMRGFQGDDGQETEVTLDGVPLNDESNPRSHGYVDAWFVIPELVQRLDVVQGVASARQGNFALAGSIDYHLALPRRGLRVRGALGNFGYGRLLALYGPERAARESFAAVELVRTDGFGPARSHERASALAQHVVALAPGATGRLLAGLFASRFDLPGVVRADDVAAGRVGFFDRYAAAGAQGGTSTRALLVAALDWRRAPERVELLAFATLRDFAVRENFTGFAERPDAGDLDEERYAGGTLGLRGTYRRTVTAFGQVHNLEVGWLVRHDRYRAGRFALDAASGQQSSEPDEPDVDAWVAATDVAGYAEGVVRPRPWLALRGGARFDALVYDVEQGGARRFATGTNLGPKAGAEVDLGAGLALVASAGTGFRTSGALEMGAGPDLPIATVASQELGVRYALAPTSRLPARFQASMAGYHTVVHGEVLFDPTAGRAVNVGDTRRLGAVLAARLQLAGWLDVGASAAFTRATVEREAPAGLVRAGEPLPYLPPLVTRVDAAVEREVGRWGASPVRLRTGVGASVWGPRPLPLGQRTEPVALLDAAVAVRVGGVELGLAGRNLLDWRWHNADLVYASSFVPGGAAGAPVRHFVAGAPRTVYATLTLDL